MPTMLILTTCLLLCLAAVVGAVYLLTSHHARLVEQSQAEMARTLVAGLETLVKPVLSPGMVQQPADQPEMFRDPDWTTDWDGSVPEDLTTSEQL